MPQRILLVEDNADDEVLTLDALRSGGVIIPVDVARDGQEAVDYLLGTGEHSDRADASLPAVVLLDLMLPKLNGHEVLRRIRAHPRTALVPVVVLTSSAEESDLFRSYEQGVNSFIQKPVDFAQFYRVVGTLGLYWSEFNRTGAFSAT